MSAEEIKLSMEANSRCLEMLKLRGDNVSLYAVAWIETLMKSKFENE